MAAAPKARRRTGGTIRSRIARTLALPVAATLILLGVIAVGEIDNYRTAVRTDRAVTLDLAVLELTEALQVERGLSVGLLGGYTEFRALLAPARQQVDRQRAAVEDRTERGGEVEDRVVAVVAQLDGLAAVRAATDTGDSKSPATLYTGLIARLVNLDFGLSAVDDSELRRNYTTLSMLSVAKESAAQERMLLAGVFAAGRSGPGEFVQFVSAKSSRDTALLAFNQYGNPAALDTRNRVLGTESGKQTATLEQLALSAADGRSINADPRVWWTASGTVLTDLLDVGREIGGTAQDNAADLRKRAGVRLGILGGAVLLCLIGAVYLAVVASRWLARPLAGLANLFELDHLATRMRRNAESLLVLVGAASPRQWTKPLPISDVIRAAVSEVEEYRRVTLRRVDDVMVNGSVVGSIAHMLAELIENGLAFSPPDVDVEIYGRALGGGYLIAVTDSGIGMTPEDMDRANQRLRGEGDFITAPARFLGHFVVGRLAAETGVRVQLTPSPVTGVTARLALPTAIISERAPLAPAESPAPGASRRLPAAPRQENPLRANTIEYVVIGGDPPKRSEMDLHHFAPSTVDAGRTVNGLRRRTPRARPQPSPSPSRVGHAESGVIADSPEAVRDRLTAFRAGVSRAGGSEK